MMRKFYLSLAAGLFLLAPQSLAKPAAAQDAVANLIHGINGLDLGAAEDFPVDIAIDGVCDFPDVIFRTVATDIPIFAGLHEIEIYLANVVGDATGCDGALAVTSRVDITTGENASIIAHLDQSGTPKVSHFSNNTAPLGAGNSRVAIVHAAVAPFVDVTLKSKGTGRKLFINRLANGDQSFPSGVPSGRLKVKISPDDRGKKLFKTGLTLADGVSYTVFAVGTLRNGTFEPLTLAIGP